MKAQLRICQQCGTKETTFSRKPLCLRCAVQNKTAKAIEDEREELLSLGYQVLSGPTYDDYNHRKWKVITPCCGIEYEPLMLTVRSMLDRTGTAPCKQCGGKTRITKAMVGYKKKYGITYNLGDRQSYVRLVRSLSDRNYRIYQQIINPGGVERSSDKHHLDHRIPVIWCFKSGLPPELPALCTNLQMLTAEENLTKGSKLTANPDEALGLNVLNILRYDAPLFQPGKLNIWPHQLSSPALSGMVLYRQARCKRISARKLELREVSAYDALAFLEQSHLAGSAGSTYRMGLWKGDQLLSIITLGHSRFSKKYDHEVIRFASAPGYAVQGAAGRLLTRARKDLEGKIICYSDNQLGDGKVYERIGMTFDGETGKGYFWEKEGKIIQRYQAQKHKLPSLLGDVDLSKSETVLMKEAGWRKVMTLGNKRWRF